jgi:hypothetical protein
MEHQFNKRKINTGAMKLYGALPLLLLVGIIVCAAYTRQGVNHEEPRDLHQADTKNINIRRASGEDVATDRLLDVVEARNLMTPFHHSLMLCDGDPSKALCLLDTDCAFAYYPDVDEDSVCVAVALDPFHITKLYPSDPNNLKNDWFNTWSAAESTADSTAVILSDPLDSDPNDPRTTLRGEGTITIDQQGVAKFSHRPRLFIDKALSSTSIKGWENLEFTAYVKIEIPGTVEAGSGLSLVARTNWFTVREGCDAPGYYARMSLVTGDVSFQKRFYWGLDGVVYTNRITKHLFEGGMPVGEWIGIKFVAYTLPNSQDVQLELYVDMSDGANGGHWTLVHSFLDTPHLWTNNMRSIPEECPVQMGDTVLGNRKTCYLHSDGGDASSVVAWKNVSIRNILKKTQKLCNGDARSLPCLSDSDCVDEAAGQTCTDVPLDRFGIKKIGGSDDAKKELDWFSKWDVPYHRKPTALTVPGEQDPYDPLTSLRGLGTVAIIAADQEIHMRHKAMLFISKKHDGFSETGWDNVEFTAYGKIVEDGEILPFSGLEMVARSNYAAGDGCSAPAYVARIHRGTGQASFQKILFDSHTDGKIYSGTRRVTLFPDGLPINTWVGMKFMVYTYTGTDIVQLDLYVDLTNGVNGGDWKLVHTTTDRPGDWLPWKSDHDISKVCEGAHNGDTVLGPRNVCFLRTDGSHNSVVAWKQASVRNIAVPAGRSA